MLIRDHRKRPNAAQCLQHPWFEKFTKTHDINSKGNKVNKEIIQNIKVFSGQLKMQQACMNFIQMHVINNKEKQRLRKVFEAIDTNFDGKLTKDEVVRGLRKMGLQNAN